MSTTSTEQSDAPLQPAHDVAVAKNIDVDINSPVPDEDGGIGESKQLELTKLSTKRRLKRYLSAQDAARPIDIEFVNMRAKVAIPQAQTSIFSKIASLCSSNSDDSKSDKDNNSSKNENNAMKEILHGVSGLIRSGEFVALMGPSGAGKSSLLNVLGDRFEGEYTGEVFVNGKPRTKALKRKIGYVLQDDVILPNLTVRETLDSTALLRLPRAMTKQEKMERVDDVIHVMGLSSCEHTLVQLTSGGERKRVSIANELLVNPSVIFLDEPTSGLDSTTAFAILTTLKELTLQGRTIICCVHQPSSQMFAKFDKLLLLASGHVVYFGGISYAPTYFKDCGYPCPVHYNPADFILELVTDNFESADPSLQNKEEIKNNLIKYWKENKSKMEEMDKKNSLSNNNNNINNNSFKDDLNGNDIEVKWQTTWIEQFLILSKRAFKHRKGHILSFWTAFEVISICIIGGILWWQVDTTEETLQTWAGAAFFIQTYLAFAVMFRGVVHFPTEKIVIKRERQSGSYRLSSYYLSKLMAETPIDIILPLIGVTFYFWMIGLGDEFITYILYMLTSCLGIMAGNSFGTFLGCFLSDFEKGITSLAVVGVFFMLIGGFLVKDRAIPDYISWITIISQMRYAFVLSFLILLDDSGNKFECAPSGETEFKVCENGNTKYISKKELLDFWDMNETVLFSIITLCCQTVVWHILAYWSLRGVTN